MPGKNESGSKNKKPFNGNLALLDAVPVRFGKALASELFNAGELLLRHGEQVVVDTTKGPALGEVVGIVQRCLVDRGRVRRIIRRATEEDVERHENNRQKARRAFRFCLERIRARDLKMKLCNVELILDGSRILFYFSADHRVDFRQLVRDLARELDARIEMRQIGVRDGAGLIGGIGPCGKELCCSSFLHGFRSISIRHAKDQGLTLNPKKVSGMCGRLMCCLVYEHNTYRTAKKGAPRINRAVATSQGTGVVTDVDLLQSRVRVLLDKGTFEVFDFSDVVVDNETIRRARDITQTQSRSKSDARVTRAGARLEEKYVWDDAEADQHPELEASGPPSSDSSSTKEERPRKRRRRRRKGPAKDQQEADASKQAQGEGAKSGGRRRRRRRKPKSQTAGGPGGQPGQSQGGQPTSGGKPEQGTDAANTQKAGASEGGRRRRRRRRRKPRGGGGTGSPGGGGTGSPGGGSKDAT